MEVLLDNGADVNARGNEGKTALMRAAARDHQIFSWYDLVSDIIRGRFLTCGPRLPHGPKDAQIVQLLLDKGADVNAKDNNGWTALKRAQKTGDQIVIELFKAHGAKE